MMTLILIGLSVVLLLVIAALGYRSRARQATHYAALQKTIADAATANVSWRHSLDRAMSTTQEIHRDETIHETDPKHSAERADFDNDWSRASGLHDTGAGADDANRAAAADPSGVTVHNRRRAYRQ